MKPLQQWEFDIYALSLPRGHGFGDRPVPFELFPEATHWFEEGGEQLCRSFYATSILWSMTLITDLDKPEPRLEDFLEKTGPEE
jgi:hypothetical protein